MWCNAWVGIVDERNSEVLWQEVHVFLTQTFTGEPSESDEMMPQWYDVQQIPLESMWAGDHIWLPHVLNGQSVQGHFHFAADEETLLDYELKVAPLRETH